jgi:hypothetical protein
VVTEHTIEHMLDNLPSSVEGPLPDSSTTALAHAEEAEMLSVRSIEGTVVEASTVLKSEVGSPPSLALLVFP